MISLYFVQDASGPIKIGYAGEPTVRLSQLQSSNPRQLTLLGEIAGGWMLERLLHQRFRRSRIRGEWFEPTDELLRFIERNATEALPPSHRGITRAPAVDNYEGFSEEYLAQVQAIGERMRAGLRRHERKGGRAA